MFIYVEVSSKPKKTESFESWTHPSSKGTEAPMLEILLDLNLCTSSSGCSHASFINKLLNNPGKAQELEMVGITDDRVWMALKTRRTDSKSDREALTYTDRDRLWRS